MLEKLNIESMLLILFKIAMKNKAPLLFVRAYYMAKECYRSPMSIFEPLKILLLINAITYEPRHEKTNILHMRKQRRR